VGTSVGIVIRLGMDDQVRFPAGEGKDFFLPRPDRQLGPPSLLSKGYLGVKPPGCEADRSLSSRAEDKNAWIYTFISQYVLTAWY
jgi:hypothetical protein